jgi:hypothetical protein
MVVPTSDVGYITAMPRREVHKVHENMWWHWIKIKKKFNNFSPENYVFCEIMWENVVVPDTYVNVAHALCLLDK